MMLFMMFFCMSSEHTKNPDTCAVSSKPTLTQLVGVFAVVIGFGILFTKLGILQPDIALAGSVGFGAVFLMGLVAASSSCIAVSGGLMLSTITHLHRTRSVILFVGGRLVAYTLLGGLIGLLGQAFIPSPMLLAVITLAAALYMLATGLTMLDFAPVWLRRLTPTVPTSVTHKILNSEGSAKPLRTVLLGGATFFLPCGFTQALQLYALTTGSATGSAMLLFAFALGTAPALLVLGFASTSLKGKTGQWFFRFAAALLVVLGVWNVQNGLVIAGVRLPERADRVDVVTSDTWVIQDEETQVVQLELSSRPPYYSPSNTFTVRAGKPVRLEIAGRGTGCRSVFQIPSVGVQEPLTKNFTVIEFTPTEVGDLVFSCSMGMYPGTIRVIPSNS